MSQASTIATFQSFLRDKSVDYIQSKEDLQSFIKENFRFFNAGLLRDLINTAIERRNYQTDVSQILGEWGDIIDAIKNEIFERQTIAGTNLQNVIALLMKGDRKLASLSISKLFKDGYVDYLFIELIEDGIEKCNVSGNQQFGQIFRFINEIIEKNKLIMDTKKRIEEQAKQATDLTVSHSSDQASNGKLNSSIQSEKLIEQPDEPTDKRVSPFPRKLELSVTEANESNFSRLIRREDDSNDSASSSDTDSDDEKDTSDKSHPIMTPAHEAVMIKTNDFLHSSIKECQGDVNSLRQRIFEAISIKTVDIRMLRFVLDDNIEACKQANYTVKVKLLTYIKSLIDDVDATEKENSDSMNFPSQLRTLYAANLAPEIESSHHAPKFIDSVETNADVAVLDNMSVFDGSNCVVTESNSTVSSHSKKKKKEMKKLTRKNLMALVDDLARHFDEHDWAVCSSYVPLDVVRRVRIEAGLFRDHYEQSEIWVGKRADIGAHLSVPSVRGDKVLWMCGAHRHEVAPEGESRLIRTKGEIEPCRLDIKAHAPLRRFSGLKELVAAVDRIVYDLKDKVSTLHGLFERSDAMLAVYPGDGSRFANHIDNTTCDGRRLTVVVYLNPEWRESYGGACRVTVKPNDRYIQEQKQPEIAKHVVDVYPEAGRLLFFDSAKIAHEVMPTYADRHAITIWYYDTEERKEAIARAREAARQNNPDSSNNRGKNNPIAQQDAKNFIAELMGGDEVAADGGDPTEETLVPLRNKVKSMSSEVVNIIAGVTGAPSEASFREGFELLTPTDLKAMRQLFRRMGLQ